MAKPKAKPVSSAPQGQAEARPAQTAAPVPDTKGKGKGKASEIDDIFASKGTATTANASSSAKPSTAPTASDTVPSGSKKKIKRKRDGADADGNAATKGDPSANGELAGSTHRATNNNSSGKITAKKQPITIVDTSALADKPLYVPPPAAAAPSKTKKRKVASGEPTKAEKDEDADEAFRDSRGTSGRRTTEDGLNIYDINELNIGKGGDTPLCPFDCECCF